MDKWLGTCSLKALLARKFKPSGNLTEIDPDVFKDPFGSTSAMPPGGRKGRGSMPTWLAPPLPPQPQLTL
eukprot:scaffold236489_cov19-Tisochrysis_lutea.AAC.1